MKHDPIYPRQQRGAALLVSLIVLLMVSLMGISALRSSVFSGKVATGVQADAMSFEAAETALGVTFRSLAEMSSQELSTRLDSGVIQYCVKNDNTAASGSCGSSGNFMDQRGLLRAQSVSLPSELLPDRPPAIIPEGYSIGDYIDYPITILATGEMPTLNLENFHLQEVVKFGPAL